jgi:hypothetical protein
MRLTHWNCWHMFHQSRNEERAYLKKRKGIVKIALRAGAPIVPVYGFFGHTSLYTVIVDPFGVLDGFWGLHGGFQ